PVTLPLPAAGVNVIATSATGFPFASFTITDRGVLTAVLAVADWLVALFAAIAAAVPAVPVAVKVTGLPVSDPDVAVRVLLPAVALSVQLPTVAMPLPFVVWLPPVIVPFPGATANVTATPVTGFPFASFTITDGGEPTAVPTVAVWLVGLFAAIVAAVPAVPVALKVTGLPLKPVEVAVSVFGPAVALSVQLPTVATPLALVVWLAPVIVPFPGATANVTATCATGFPFPSFTITDGGDVTAVPAVADWLVGLFAAIVAAAPAVPVAVNVTGLPVSDPDVAVSVLVPAVGPGVRRPGVARPLPLVVCVPPVTLPLPAAGVNVTATSATGFPFASFTITDGGDVTAVPAVADWLVGLFAAIVAAAPAVPVAVNVTGLPVSDPDVAVSVFDPAVALRVHELRVAIPSDPVLTGVAGVPVPPPAAVLDA